jgi:CheY-like chemotaxis protein
VGTVRVLVVDDNRDLARLQALLLNHLGFEARFAVTGSEAIRMVQEKIPQVVILDIGLPEMDGMEVATHLRKAFPHLHLIALSGHYISDRQAFRAGFDYNFTKPMSMEDLVKVLNALPTKRGVRATG